MPPNARAWRDKATRLRALALRLSEGDERDELIVAADACDRFVAELAMDSDTR
jgi:hypothetical protein